jgi:AraC-like DNA-binding protein
MIAPPGNMTATPELGGEEKMDALSDVLRVSHLTGGVFLYANFSAPWCMAAHIPVEHCGPYLGPASHLITYHYVIEGELRLRMENASDETHVLGPGEAVMMPRNEPHLMGSDLSLPPRVWPRHRPAPQRWRSVFDQTWRRWRPYPYGLWVPWLRLRRCAAFTLKVEDAGAGEWIRSTFHFAADEVAAGRPGSEITLAKLSELLFVEAVRRYAESLPEGQTGWLAGLRDPHVARALALIHNDVARPWTVDELGREIGLARSALTDRFNRLIGAAPMHYLASWRMQVAAQKLRSTSASLAQVADAVGYDSESAFSRAFKKAFGTAPATWRRLNRSTP